LVSAWLRAILDGHRDPEYLLSLCESIIRSRKRAEILASLQGTYRNDQLFALRQALQCYEFYQQQILACEREMDRLLTKLTLTLPEPVRSSAAKPTRHHQPAIDDLHTKLMRLSSGNNPAAITGLTEVGTDLSAWPPDKHFISWLGLAPRKHQSGKRSSRERFVPHPHTGQIFRTAAQSLALSKNSAFGAFYRRIRAKRGPKVAMKAVARKLALMYYHAMTNGLDFVEQGLQLYEQRFKEQHLARLHKQARRLGFTLAPVAT
jgi:hypothetical protein